LTSNESYLLQRIKEKNALLAEAVEKLNYSDNFDYERQELARRIEEHINEPYFSKED